VDGVSSWVWLCLYSFGLESILGYEVAGGIVHLRNTHTKKISESVGIDGFTLSFGQNKVALSQVDVDGDQVNKHRTLRKSSKCSNC